MNAGDILMPDLPIRFDNVTVVAGGVTLLDHVTLEISAGSPTLLIGPNGAGKTTLLRAAMGLIRPTSGRITWAGAANGSPARRAIMLQRPTMLRRSAIANIRYALTAAGQSVHKADELLDRVGLAHAARRPARRLSGGEQHRLALARALAREPELLLLDEPTASLDPASTKAIEDVIGAIGRRIKVVMSTHDLAEARRLAGDIVLLHQGRVVEAAEASRFFADPRTTEARKFVAGELLV